MSDCMRYAERGHMFQEFLQNLLGCWCLEGFDCYKVRGEIHKDDDVVMTSVLWEIRRDVNTHCGPRL